MIKFEYFKDHMKNDSDILIWKKPDIIPVEDVEDGLAEHAGDPVHLVGRVARQDEDPSLVVTDAALVLHLIRMILKHFK